MYFQPSLSWCFSINTNHIFCSWGSDKWSSAFNFSYCDINSFLKPCWRDARAFSISHRNIITVGNTYLNVSWASSPLRMVSHFAVSTAFSISIITPRLRTKRQERIIKQQNNQSLWSTQSRTYLQNCFILKSSSKLSFETKPLSSLVDFNSRGCYSQFLIFNWFSKQPRETILRSIIFTTNSLSRTI